MLRSLTFDDTIPFLLNLYNEVQEEKLWTIYLSNPYREQSFNEFKNSLVGSGKSKEEIEKEAQHAAASALESLNIMDWGEVNGN